ncbi:MAG: restriction endonuclease subunit S [Treponema sp.]|nr:restriction endonuclease subunit S [Treponema sp.]
MMKKDWIIKKLGEVVKVERGSSPRPIEKYLTTESNGVNWVKIGDTKNVDKVILSTKEKITPEGAEKSRFVQKGDFILSNSMSLGKPYIMGIDGYIHDGWFVLRLPETIDSDYFFYHLSSDFVQNQFSGLAAGAIVKNISSDLVKKANLIIPPLEEQKRIVAVLDKKFAQIEKLKTAAEKNLQNTKQLFQAELEKAFSNTSWEKKTIQEICTLKSGNSSTNNSKPGTLPYVKVGDMTIVGNEKSITTSTTFVDYESNKKQVFPIGSVIFPKRGGAILTNKKRITSVEICCDLNIMGVIPGEKICPNFLYYYFIGIDFSKLCNGAAIPQINNIDINPLEINLPPLEEQKRIVAHLDSLSEKVHQLEEIYTKQLADCDELKQSLLQKAFEGEL